jgi:hypothetical protein
MKRSLVVAVLSALLIVLGGAALITVIHRPLIVSMTPWETSRQHPKSERVYEGSGPEHCGLQDTTLLYLNGIGYVRDVNGELVQWTHLSYEAGATLPPGAKFTGWHDGQREVWTDPRADDAGPLSVYIVSPGGIERWPRFGVCF